MSAGNRTPPAKPSKPYRDFPLFPHATRWSAKKVRGQVVCFDRQADRDGALAKYLEQKDSLHAGRKAREVSEGVTVKERCNRFLDAELHKVQSGELIARSWQDYRDACDLVVAEFRSNPGRFDSNSDSDV
ncbi:MAG TPA: hypothetical protein VGF55_17505 [Gemmataceae bacterium]|jgi:hypothetical protein